MFQSFDATTTPDQGPPRLAALRDWMATVALDGFLVPRADKHQGEYVAPCDDRLAWLTGFTGSAGFACVLCDHAGVFIDGRYRVQVIDQVADIFTPVHWPETGLADWLKTNAVPTARIGFDPWLHTVNEIETLRAALAATDITLVPAPNGVDAIWVDRPAPPAQPAFSQPIERSGEKSGDKVARLARNLADLGQSAAVLTLPDSICWLLNIRGRDNPHVPIVHAFAILRADATVELFSDLSKFADLGPDPKVDQYDWSEFETRLAAQAGPVRFDPLSAPVAVATTLGAMGIAGEDPCSLPKACKNAVEIQGARDAHIRDGAAMCRFLAWVDGADTNTLTEIDVARALEGFRRDTGQLFDISFDTISGAGPHGAIVHYRVTNDTNRPLDQNNLLLVDSGGQYADGTTDITRTMAIGTPTNEMKQCFTRVLQGMIAVSRVRFPKGLAGRDLDALARAPLWMAGQDYDHGTGHGVGSFLSVHEGPQRLSRVSSVPLQPGMILSNEPGYYRQGAFGIRIENLIVVQDAPPRVGGDDRAMLSFETLTYVPIDRALIERSMLSDAETQWVNEYHQAVWDKISPSLDDVTQVWLRKAVAPL